MPLTEEQQAIIHSEYKSDRIVDNCPVPSEDLGECCTPSLIRPVNDTIEADCISSQASTSKTCLKKRKRKDVYLIRFWIIS